MLPTLWFRNTWSWGDEAVRPGVYVEGRAQATNVITASHRDLGLRFLYLQGAPELLFTENETNTERLFNTANRTPFVKDAFHNYLVHGRQDLVNPSQVGTKSAALYQLTVPAAGKETIRLRLNDVPLPGTYGPSADEPIGS